MNTIAISNFWTDLEKFSHVTVQRVAQSSIVPTV
jgi:hypothetical protein